VSRALCAANGMLSPATRLEKDAFKQDSSAGKFGG
jgi:hypothetical protein